MRILLFPLLVICAAATAQTNCTIGLKPGSNEIEYNAAEVEKIIDFGKYRAVLYGEGHIRDFEPGFKLSFIKHLNQQFGFRHVFMEIGYSAAFLYNQFLQTGDSSIFSLYKPVYSQRSYRTFWTGLYEYNRILPDSLKIIIHGPDFERTELLKLLIVLQQKTMPVPGYLKPGFDEIKQMSEDKSINAFDKSFIRKIAKIKQLMLENPEDFKNLYKENYPLILKAVTNVAPQTTKVHPRNRAWIINIENMVSENHIDKMICFFGKAHLFEYNDPSMARLIKRLPVMQGRAVNITSVYHHFLSMGYMGNKPAITEYEHGSKEMYEQFAQKGCRATIVPSSLMGNKFSRKADYVLLAKDIVTE